MVASVRTKGRTAGLCGALARHGWGQLWNEAGMKVQCWGGEVAGNREGVGSMGVRPWPAEAQGCGRAGR